MSEALWLCQAIGNHCGRGDMPISCCTKIDGDRGSRDVNREIDKKRWRKEEE